MQREWITRSLWIAVLLLACCTPKPDGPITAVFDGVYNGNGYSASPPGSDCPAVMPADTLSVSGGYATFRFAWLGRAGRHSTVILTDSKAGGAVSGLPLPGPASVP